MSPVELRPCPFCGGPALPSVELRQSAPTVVERIECGWCGISLRSNISRPADLAAVWNTRFTDDILKDMIPVIKMALAMFRSQGLPAATEVGLLARIEVSLKDAP
jgi:hypothetical protein